MSVPGRGMRAMGPWVFTVSSHLSPRAESARDSWVDRGVGTMGKTVGWSVWSNDSRWSFRSASGPLAESRSTVTWCKVSASRK